MMNNAPALSLDRFRSRIRWMRALSGAWLGVYVGAAAVGSAAILGRVLHQTVPVGAWPCLFLLPVALVAIIYFRRPLTDAVVADSIDRRARLKNRIGTAVECQKDSSPYCEPLLADAVDHLERVQPKKLFPSRFSRFQVLAVVTALLAAGLAMLGNRPIILSQAERAKRAEAEQAASAIEQVARPLEELQKQGKLSATQTAQMTELQKLARDLQNGQADKSDAMQKANAMMDEAKKLEQQQIQSAKQDLKTADGAMAGEQANAQPGDAQQAQDQKEAEKLQSQIDQLQRRLDKARGEEKKKLEAQLNDLKNQLAAVQQSMKERADMQNAELQAMQNAASQNKSSDQQIRDALQLKLNHLPPGGGLDPLAEFERQQSALKAKLQREVANIRQRLKTAKGDEAKRLETKLKALESELATVKEQLEAYRKALQKELDERAKARKAGKPAPQPFQKMLHPKFNKEMQAAMPKLKAALAKIESGDDLSPSEQQDLKKLAASMSMQAAQAAGRGNKEMAMTGKLLANAANSLSQGETSVAIELQGALGMGGGPGEITEDWHNTGKVNHLKKAVKSEGKTTPSMVDPLRGDSGPEAYIEIKGPATVGRKGGVPYQTVLPSYQRKVESALNQSKIPKQQEKRVRAYFESLHGK